jgi:pimeloyl-ACP methyl ester carboxylesterase
MIEKVQSADGTTIAYERAGSGPALIVVGGAFNVRLSASGLVPLLASDFTVYSYDRRGRGDSTDTLPYAVEREVEDLVALADAAGGSVALYGHSSGGVLALEAVAAGLATTQLAVYEPPYSVGDVPRVAADYATRVQAAADAGRRDEVAHIFFREAVGLPEEALQSMAAAPFWPGMLAVAHTIPYENALVGDGSVPTDRLGRIVVPTLVISGGSSPEDMRAAADSVATAIPNAQRLVLEGQDHAVANEVVAPVLVSFLS